MPRLLLFGLCQKAIIDRQEGSVSMIALIGTLRIQTNAAIAGPPDATLPISWYTVASWVREPEDGERIFQPRIEMLSPSGKQVSIADGEPFVMREWSLQSMIGGFGIPLTEQGIYNVKLSLREHGTEDWKEISSYPFQLEIIQIEPVPSEQAAP